MSAILGKIGAEMNARRNDGRKQRGRNHTNALAVDMFPEARVDLLVDGDQRFTLRETNDWCRRVAGVEEWDLDVAACVESHLAPHYFDKEQDGLKQRWVGRVWCNPPFSDIGPWVIKAWEEIHESRGTVIAMLLPASRTEQAWWQNSIEPHRDGRGGSIVDLRTYFLPSRTRFGHPGNPEGMGVGSPPFGCVLLVWRRP